MRTGLGKISEARRARPRIPPAGDDHLAFHHSPKPLVPDVVPDHFQDFRHAGLQNLHHRLLVKSASVKTDLPREVDFFVRLLRSQRQCAQLLFELFRPGIGNFQPDREVLGQVIPPDPVHRGMNHRTLVPDAHIGDPGAEIDDHGTPPATFLRKDGEPGGITGKGAAFHPDFLVGKTLDAGLQAGVFAGDEVVVGLDLFRVDTQRIHRSDAAVERIAPEELMKDGVIARQRQMGGQLLKFVQRSLGDAVLVLRQGCHPDGFIARGQMGSAQIQVNLGNFGLGAPFRVGQGHPGGQPGMSEVGDLRLAHPGGSGFAHAEKREGTVRGEFRHGHGHFLRAEVRGDDDFVGGGCAQDHVVFSVNSGRSPARSVPG